jgi:hypothetical protein
MLCADTSDTRNARHEIRRNSVGRRDMVRGRRGNGLEAAASDGGEDHDCKSEVRVCPTRFRGSHQITAGEIGDKSKSFLLSFSSSTTAQTAMSENTDALAPRVCLFFSALGFCMGSLAAEGTALWPLI